MAQWKKSGSKGSQDFRSFLKQQKQQQQQQQRKHKENDDDDDDIEIVVAPLPAAAPTAPGKMSTLCRRFGCDIELNSYIEITCGRDEDKLVFYVPEMICMFSSLMHAMLSGEYREKIERKINLPDVRPEIMEEILSFLFQELLENGPPPTPNPGSTEIDSSSSSTRPNRVAFLFTLKPEIVMDLLIASSYLGIPILTRNAILMLAEYIEAVPTLSGLPKETIRMIYDNLTPASLCAIESSEVHQEISHLIDTNPTWKKHCEKRGFLDRLPVATSSSSSSNNNNSTDAVVGEPNYKELYIQEDFQRKLSLIGIAEDPAGIIEEAKESGFGLFIRRIKLDLDALAPFGITLAQILEMAPRLSYLDLSGRAVSHEALADLAAAIAQGRLKNLETLDLTQAGLDHAMVTAFFDTLQPSHDDDDNSNKNNNNNSSSDPYPLRRLVLTHNNIGTTGADRVAQFIASDVCQIERLEMRGVGGFDFNNLLKAIGIPKKTNTNAINSNNGQNSLRYLDVSSNEIIAKLITPDALEAFSSPAFGLTHLILSGNHLNSTRPGRSNWSSRDEDNEPLKRLWSAIATNNTIQHLDLSECMIGDRNMSCLIDALYEARNTVLQHLDLTSNEVGLMCITSLAKLLLDAKPNLHTLNLSQNDIREEVGILARSIAKNPTITRLNIERNRMQASDALAALHVIVQSNTTGLKHLSMTRPSRFIDQLQELAQKRPDINISFLY